jgi:hypothetical protein
MNSADEEVLLNNLAVNILHLYNLFSFNCCHDADRYFITFVAILLAVLNVESVVLYLEGPLIRDNDSALLQNLY